MSDYNQCPAKFYFGRIVRLPRPATEATTVGTLAHEAFEFAFDHPLGERTPDVVTPYVAQAWEKLRDKPDYAHLVEDADKLIARAEEMVRGWFATENPNRFDPVGREEKIVTNVGKVPVLGILDRVDRIEVKGEQRLYISDYKTGKVPAVNDRYLDDKFFAMRVYALMWQIEHGETPHELRLVYVAGASPGAVRRVKVDDAMLKRARTQVTAMHKSMTDSAAKGEWECKRQPLCQWCDFIDLCPQWHPDLAGLEVGDIRSQYEAGREVLVDPPAKRR